MADVVCPSCGKTNPSGFAFCGYCANPLTAPAFPWFPTEERKVVTVLFADLSDFTALGGRVDPEVVRDITARFFAASREEIRKFAGSVEKFIGDAVMAVFGLPQTHEDDPVRAVRAALAIRQRLDRLNEEYHSDFGVIVSIHIGIDTGEVMAAAGPAEGRDFLVTGEAVNVAARLEKLAKPNQILIGERTYRFTRRHFQFRPLGGLELKGKEAPVPVWEVMSAFPSLVGSRVAGRLVGRDEELAQLKSYYDEVVASRRLRLVTIVGLPGVGKSRLFQEFTASVAGSEPAPAIRAGRCLPYGEAITYTPLADILKEECGVLDSDPPSIAREKVVAVSRQIGAADLADPLGYTIGIERPASRIGLHDPRLVGQELIRAWRVFFEARARAHPMVVHFEDLHWAADALLELIESVASGVTDAPLLIIGTARPELLERRRKWGLTTDTRAAMFLEALSPLESEVLLADLLPSELVPSPLRSDILARAEGNPFFLEEMVRMLLDEGVVVHTAGQWRMGKTPLEIILPDTIQGVIANRIDMLSGAQKAILQFAAVIGRTFWLGALRALTDDRNVGDALEALERREFVQEHTRPTLIGEREYIFNHILIREVTYGSLPRGTKGRMHRQVAEWLEQVGGGRVPDSIELLAHHYQEAAMLLGDEECRRKAGTYLRQAAESAHRRYALQQAMTYAQAALRFVEEGQQAGINELLADTMFLTGRLLEAERLFREALKGYSRPHDRARIHRKLVPTLEMDRAVKEVELARELLAHEPDIGEEAAILTWMGRFADRRMEYLQAADLFNHARKMLEGTANRPDLARCLYYLGNTLIHLGQYGEAHTVAEELRIIADGLQSPYFLAQAHRLMGDVQLCRGENAAALRAAEFMLEAGVSAGVEVIVGGLRRKGKVLHRLGRLKEAADVLTEASTLSEQVEYPEELQARISEDLATALADLGRHNEALVVLARGTRMAEAKGYGQLLVGMAVAALYVDSLARRPKESLAQCEAVLRRWPNSRALQVQALAVIADAWAEFGSTTRAEETARQCLEIASRDGATHEMLVAKKVLGRVEALRERWPQAVKYLREAAEGFSNGESRVEWGRAIVCLAEAVARVGRFDDARTLLDQSRAVLTECEASEDVRRLERARTRLKI